jgi:hypothetical protein
MMAQLDRANAEAFDCSFIEGSKDDAPPGLEHAALNERGTRCLVCN